MADHECLPPVPPGGPERVAWWASLEQRLAEDASYQRTYLGRLAYEPEQVDGWLDAYYARHVDMAHRAIYKEPAP